MTQLTADHTTVELPRSDQALISAVAAALGVIAGLLLPRIAGWAVSLPWVAWRDVLTIVDRYATGWVAWALPVLGLVTGLIVAATVVHETARLQVGADDLVVVKGDRRRRFARAQVSRVLVEDRHLVLRGRLDEDLIRERLDVSRDAVLEAVRRYDWPTAS